MHIGSLFLFPSYFSLICFLSRLTMSCCIVFVLLFKKFLIFIFVHHCSLNHSCLVMEFASVRNVKKDGRDWKKTDQMIGQCMSLSLLCMITFIKIGIQSFMIKVGSLLVRSLTLHNNCYIVWCCIAQILWCFWDCVSYSSVFLISCFFNTNW